MDGTPDPVRPSVGLNDKRSTFEHESGYRIGNVLEAMLNQWQMGDQLLERNEEISQ